MSAEDIALLDLASASVFTVALIVYAPADAPFLTRTVTLNSVSLPAPRLSGTESHAAHRKFWICANPLMLLIDSIHSMSFDVPGAFTTVMLVISNADRSTSRSTSKPLSTSFVFATTSSVTDSPANTLCAGSLSDSRCFASPKSVGAGSECLRSTTLPMSCTFPVPGSSTVTVAFVSCVVLNHRLGTLNALIPSQPLLPFFCKLNDFVDGGLPATVTVTLNGTALGSGDPSRLPLARAAIWMFASEW